MTGKAFSGLTAFILLLGLPLLLVVFASTAHLSLPLIPIALIIIYSSAHLAHISSSASQNIVTTTFWVFSYLFLGLAPFLQLVTNTFPWSGTYDTATTANSALLILAGLLAFDFGRHLMPGRGVGVPRALRRPVSRTNITVLAILLLASSPYLLSRLGGTATLFIPRSELSQTLMSEFELPAMMLLTNALKTPAYVLLVGSLAIWLARRARGERVGPRWKMMAFVLLVATLVLNNPISTARLKVGTILLSLFFVLPWRRWSGAATTFGLIFGLLFVFPFADLFRASLDTQLSDRIAESTTISELTENGDFDAFQMVANGVDALDRNDFQLGRQTIGALFFWVPRSIWSGKPIPTGQWIAEQQGYSFTNLSSPLWVELYIDGGLFLLVFGFIGYGYLVRTIDRWYALSQRSGDVRVISIIVPIYAGYQFFVLRGSLMPAVAYFAPILLVAITCSIHMSGRWPRPARNRRTRNFTIIKPYVNKRDFIYDDPVR